MIQEYPGRPVPKETFTHSHPSWSSHILYKLPPFTMIHSILFVQFTCLTDSPFQQSLSRSSLVFLLVLDTLLYTPCISSPSHHLLYAAHAHTIAACSVVIPMLCHLYLISLLAPYLEICLRLLPNLSAWWESPRVNYLLSWEYSSGSEAGWPPYFFHYL